MTALNKHSSTAKFCNDEYNSYSDCYEMIVSRDYNDPYNIYVAQDICLHNYRDCLAKECKPIVKKYKDCIFSTFWGLDITGYCNSHEYKECKQGSKDFKK